MAKMSNNNDKDAHDPIIDHRRQWGDFHYVYPVISRRSRGLSIGVNLNLDKRCNFSCMYCQVNRQIAGTVHHVDLAVLANELAVTLQAALSGEIWAEPRLAGTDESMRRINDIAFSGDGEPTCLAQFDKAVEVAAGAKAQAGLDDVKIVVITNATRLDSPQFIRALPILDSANGEIWAKLDAGSEEYFSRVNRPHPGITLGEIVSSIARIAKGRPVVIPSLFFSLDNTPPSADEIDAYCGRLQAIRAAGGQIKLVQAHTVARVPASPSVSALSDGQLDAIAETIRAAVKGVPVETSYGRDAPGVD